MSWSVGSSCIFTRCFSFPLTTKVVYYYLKSSIIRIPLRVRVAVCPHTQRLGFLPSTNRSNAMSTYNVQLRVRIYCLCMPATHLL
ncbi:unnamed protein product [Amoebophrya sp. A25]|nr:unnamed protein product [Amoebophrya sp. A25]|eukprot:GSA25T00002253001.1